MSEGYLIDTSILSLLAPGRGSPSPDVAAWLRANGDRLYISSVSIAEIEQGICKLRRSGGVERAERLSEWLAQLLAQSDGRIIAFDIDAAMMAGQMSDRAFSSGRHPGFADVAIAATAASRGYVIATANVRHFAALEVDVFDPTSAP